MNEETAEGSQSTQPASRWRRAAARVEMALGIFFVCVCYGAGYGAAFGAAIGVIPGLFSLLGPGGGLAAGAFIGAPCGAIGGGILAIIGCMVGKRAGWVLPGLLGGSVFPVGFWFLAAANFGWGPFVIMVSVTSVLLGGFLGHALNRGLQGAASAVPGLQNVTSLILEWNCTSEGQGCEADPAPTIAA
jgi:hypothetical protein